MTDFLFLSILLIFSAFFSGSEVALFSLSKSELLKYSLSSNRTDKLIADIMKGPEKVLVTILIGNLLANLMIPALSARLLLNTWRDYGHFVAIAIVTPVIILFCDIIPKTVARSDPQRFSQVFITLIYAFHKVFSPIRFLLLAINNFIIRSFKLAPAQEKITEEELDMAIKMGVKEGVIGVEESAFIKNVLRFSRKEAQNIMIPRNQAIFIPYGSSIAESARVFHDTGLVRAVVYKKDLDHVVGMLDSRELIPYMWGYKRAGTINKLIHPVSHYPSTKELGELLTDFLKRKIQIAVVIDEYGGTAGLVTLNAILSELMGKEFSSFEEIYRPGIKKIGTDVTVISGEMQIDDFNYEFDEHIDSRESETIGGYLIEKIGHFPKRNDSVLLKKHILRVRRIIRNRIEAIEVMSGVKKQ